MRIHFTASMPCVLRLGGAPVGLVGEIKKFAELERGEEVLVEFLPADGEFLPVSFLYREGTPPPLSCDLWRSDCGVHLRAERFCRADPAPRPLAQARAAGMLATVIESGSIRLAVQGEREFCTPVLPRAESYELAEETLWGEKFLRLYCRGNGLLLFFHGGKEVFRTRADSFSCDGTLHTRTECADIARHVSERSYGENFSLAEEKVTAQRESFDERLLAPALFEAMLAGADPSPLLASALKPRAQQLWGYLGAFDGVFLPEEVFYLVHGTHNAADLSYRAGENVWDLRHFAVQTEEGKVSNIFPVP